MLRRILKKLSSENGSATLFVTVVMLFFVVVLTTWLFRIRSEAIEQDKQIEIIQQEYNSNTQNIDDIYKETVDKLNNGNT